MYKILIDILNRPAQAWRDLYSRWNIRLVLAVFLATFLAGGVCVTIALGQLTSFVADPVNSDLELIRK